MFCLCSFFILFILYSYSPFVLRNYSRPIFNKISGIIIIIIINNNNQSLIYAHVYIRPTAQEQKNSVQVIRNTAHRPRTQASYTASRVRLNKRKSIVAAQIAARLTISFPC